METTAFTHIEKEMILNLHFPQGEVLEKSNDLNKRSEAISRALAMGNLEHSKVKIYFEDDLGQKMVETTIWGVTDSLILLKQNMVMPIERILKLEL
jgi:hypothetical protein